MIGEEEPAALVAPAWTSSNATLRAIMARAASAPGGEAE
jgi:hypothetical protein